MHVIAKAFDEPGFVGSVYAVGLGPRESFLEQLAGKRLRRLRQHDALAGNRGGN